MHHIRQPAWSQPPDGMTVCETARATQAVNWASTSSMPVLAISLLIRRRLTSRYSSSGVRCDYSPPNDSTSLAASTRNRGIQ
jgi:hypothetical protein